MSTKILIIDDNEDDLLITKRFLKQAGYSDIVTAATGEDGVEKYKQEKPGLVISDTMMPGIDGFQVCEQIRQAQGEDEPKIIIVTGAIVAVDAVKAREVGADDYCAKTSDGAPLLDAVGKLVKE